MKQKDASTQVYTIVVGVDFSEASALALREAARLTRSHSQSHLHVVHVGPSPTLLTPTLGAADPSLGGSMPIANATEVLEQETRQSLQSYIEKTLADRAAELADAPIRWTIHVRHGAARHVLTQLASDLHAELIVIGTHGRRGLERFLMGSVAEGVVRFAPCPVLVVRPVGAQSAHEAEDSAPAIEPPCPDCLEARRASGGQEVWCARHREHHERAHTYHFTPFKDSHSSGLFIHP